MIAINKYIIAEDIKEEMKTSSGLLLSEHDAEQFRYAKAKVYRNQMVLEGMTCSILRENDVVVVV